MSENNNVNFRPRTMAEFVGQKDIRENLAIFIEAANTRNDTLDHVLLYGPPGLGKTTLARIVAHELGSKFYATSGPVVRKIGELAATLSQLQPRDVLFIDEIHRLHPKIEEVLYSALEDYRIDLMVEDSMISISLAPFTLVGATTRAGLLTQPMVDRFGIPLRLEFYSVEELETIIKRGAERMHIPLTQAGATEIATRSRGTPRIAGRLLRRVRDIVSVGTLNSSPGQPWAAQAEIDEVSADAALNRLNIDKLGLDPLDRRYLLHIAERHSGGPVGVETLAASLSEARDTLEDVVEPFLLQAGFVTRTSRGRMLGDLGWRHLGLAHPLGWVSRYPVN